MLEIFSERLRELRKEANLSARQLASKIGVSNATVIKWEHSKQVPSMENIYNLAVFFGVSADYLIGLEN